MNKKISIILIIFLTVLISCKSKPSIYADMSADKFLSSVLSMDHYIFSMDDYKRKKKGQKDSKDISDIKEYCKSHSIEVVRVLSNYILNDNSWGTKSQNKFHKSNLLYVYKEACQYAQQTDLNIYAFSLFHSLYNGKITAKYAYSRIHELLVPTSNKLDFDARIKIYKYIYEQFFTNERASVYFVSENTAGIYDNVSAGDWRRSPESAQVTLSMLKKVNGKKWPAGEFNSFISKLTYLYKKEETGNFVLRSIYSQLLKIASGKTFFENDYKNILRSLKSYELRM